MHRNCPALPAALTLLLLPGPCAAPACTRAPAAIVLPSDQPPPIWPGPGAGGLRPPGAPTPNCGAAVTITGALPDPRDVPDREGEWLELANDDPVPIQLVGWTLRSGRRRRALDEVILPAGGRLRLAPARSGARSLRPIRLRNGHDVVRLVDPCGTTADSLAWGCPAPAPGTVVIRLPAGSATGALGPVRYEAGGAERGGCGQT